MEIDEIGSTLKKYDKTITGLTAIATGFISWEVTATRKFPNGDNTIPLFSAQRFGDALTGIVGVDIANQVAHMLDPNCPTLTGQQQIQIWGWWNFTTQVGIAAGIANWLLDKYVKQYRNLPVLPAMLKGSAYGLIAGGVIGGIFDPETSTAPMYNPSRSNSSNRTTMLNYTISG